MIHQIVHHFLQRRHFWRHATFSEVAEIYTSRMLRMLAINIASAFVSIYLYQNGYSVGFIAVYWTFFYLWKVIIALPAAAYTARFGPKHGTLLANLLYIPSMVIYALVPEWGIPALLVAGILQGTSSAMYNICYMIDFSKVKSVEHAGKEIAYMNIVEKMTTGLSPFLGGVLAYFAGPQSTMVVAAILFAFAAVPLFRTGEPLEVGQKLSFRGFPWGLVWRSLVAQSATGFDSVASGTVWSLLVAVSILGIHNNAIYAQMGALLSVVLIVALTASYIYGQLIDRRRGGELLRVAVVGDSLVHLMRPFVTSPIIVAGVNAANETATTGYMMAFTRGLFDTADLSGHRVAYIGCVEMVFNAGSVAACLVFLGLVTLLGDISGMRAVFFVTAAAVLLIATPKFRLYQR